MIRQLFDTNKRLKYLQIQLIPFSASRDFPLVIPGSELLPDICSSRSLCISAFLIRRLRPKTLNCSQMKTVANDLFN